MRRAEQLDNRWGVVSEMPYEKLVRWSKVFLVVKDEVKNRVSESLVTVERFDIELSVAGRKYIIPVKVDTLNLDDRDFQHRHDRGFLFYVEGYPDISNHFTGFRKDGDSVYAEWLQGFKGYLTHILKVLQRWDNLENRFENLRQFEVTKKQIAAE